MLNYENKKNQGDGDGNRVKHKVRNFKLKFSRMTTCFATIAALGSFRAPVNRQDVLEQIHLTPRERIENVAVRWPNTNAEVSRVLEEYAWFLEMTALPEQELLSHFSDKTKRSEMFSKANKYGASMYQLLSKIDMEIGSQHELLRYLVI